MCHQTRETCPDLLSLSICAKVSFVYSHLWTFMDFIQERKLLSNINNKVTLPCSSCFYVLHHSLQLAGRVLLKAETGGNLPWSE